MKDKAIWWLGAVAFLTVMILVWRQDSKTESELQVEETKQVQPKKESPESAFDRLRIPSAKEASQRHAERHRLAELHPEEYFNPDYLRGSPNRRAYGEKVFRHHAIKKFLTFPHKDELPYRQVMILLLENGYDIDDWQHVIGTLTARQVPYLAWKKQMLQEGFPIEEIEESVAEMQMQREEEESLWRDGIRGVWRGSMGIDDYDLLDALAAIEFSTVPTTPQLPGYGIGAALKGERLLTDDDWLDDEFRAAIARYEGEPKPSFQQRLLSPYIEEINTKFDESGRRVMQSVKPKNEFHETEQEWKERIRKVEMQSMKRRQEMQR